MPWMSENSHTFNPNRSVFKDKVIKGRAKEVLDDDSYQYLSENLYEMSKKNLDRDIEIGIALDVVELISVIGDYEAAAQLADYEIRREVDSGRISPADGCVARDLTNRLAPGLFDMSDYISNDSYLKTKKSKNNNVVEADILGLKMCLYNYAANALMDEESANEFQKIINKNSRLVIDCDMEFNIFFSLLDALYAGVDDHIAASIMATDINREIALKRITPDSTALIHYLIMNFAPKSFINKAYVTTNHSKDETIDIKSLNLK